MQEQLGDQNTNQYFDELLLIAKRLSAAEQQAAEEKLQIAQTLAEAAKKAAEEKLAAAKRYAESEKLIAAEKFAKIKFVDENQKTLEESSQTKTEPAQKPEFETRPKNTLFTTSPARVRQILDEAEASTNFSVESDDNVWRRRADLHNLEDSEQIVKRLVEESRAEPAHYSRVQTNIKL